MLWSTSWMVSASEKINVTFVSPNPPGTGYWQHYDNAMHAAADKLNINLTIIHSRDLDRFAYMESLSKVDLEETDYAIALLKVNVADKLLKMFEQSNVKLITNNIEIPEQHAQQIGLPRQKYKNWIGHVIPDDYDAGKLLASELLKHYKAKQSDPIGIVALSGSRDASVSYLRNKGLSDLIANNGNFRLEQVIYTDWKYQTAKQKFAGLIKRYPNTKVIWCASDEIAQAVLDELNANNALNDYRVGSIDWSQSGVNLFGQTGYITSVGGHFLEGGLILSLLRDYHDGIDFEQDLGSRLLIKMGALNRQNLKQVEDLIFYDNWEKLNFRLLSKSFGGDPTLLKNDYPQLLDQIYDK